MKSNVKKILEKHIMAIKGGRMTLIKITRKIKAKNALHRGFGSCSRCGANWGWKKHTNHMVSENRGVFLFCVDCDKIVTVEERHKALDEWKEECKRQILKGYSSIREIAEHISEVDSTEFIEFPRKEVV